MDDYVLAGKILFTLTDPVSMVSFVKQLQDIYRGHEKDIKLLKQGQIIGILPTKENI